MNIHRLNILLISYLDHHNDIFIVYYFARTNLNWTIVRVWRIRWLFSNPFHQQVHASLLIIHQFRSIFHPVFDMLFFLVLTHEEYSSHACISTYNNFSHLVYCHTVRHYLVWRVLTNDVSKHWSLGLTLRFSPHWKSIFINRHSIMSPSITTNLQSWWTKQKCNIRSTAKLHSCMGENTS